MISNQANNGTYALKIKGLGASNFTIENLTPNTQYELSAFTKVVGNQGVNFGVKEFNGTTDQAISVTSQVYEKKTHTFTTGPNNTSAQIYWYSANTNGEGYIDDISLQQLTVTSINSSNTQNQFYAYPNPTNNLLYLSKVLNWELTTIQGSIIKSGFGKQINTTSLPTGTFLLQTRHKTIRIVKQ